MKGIKRLIHRVINESSSSLSNQNKISFKYWKINIPYRTHYQTSAPSSKAQSNFVTLVALFPTSVTVVDEIAQLCLSRYPAHHRPWTWSSHHQPTWRSSTQIHLPLRLSPTLPAFELAYPLSSTVSLLSHSFHFVPATSLPKVPSSSFFF